MFLVLFLFSCRVEWIDPSDFSLMYKNPISEEDTSASSDQEDTDNQNISETNSEMQTENQSEDESGRDTTNPENKQDTNTEDTNSPNEEPENTDLPENQEDINQEDINQDQETILLEEGSWGIYDVVIASEDCNVDSWSMIVDIFELVPEEFTISSSSTSHFTMTLLQASIPCSIENGQFSCDTYETTIPVPNFDAVGDVSFSYDGFITNSSSFEMQLQIDIFDCQGTDCSILGFFVPYPCSIQLEGMTE